MNGEAAVDDAAPAAEAAARPASVGRPVAATSPSSTRCATSGGTNAICCPLLDRDRHPGLPRLRLGERAAAPAVTFIAWKALADNPNVRMGCSDQLRADLAVGEPARRGAGLVRPLAQGPRHRHHGRPADPLRACRAPRDGAPPTHGRRRAARIANWRCAPTARSTTTRASRAPAIHGARRRAQPRASPARSIRRRMLTWTSAPLDATLDVVGDIELRLVAVGDRGGHRMDRDPAGRRPRRRRSPT